MIKSPEVLLLKMTKVSKDDLYSFLMEKHGWTPEQIADMNPHQQLIAYRGPTIQTMTMEQYQEFQRSRR